LRKIYKLTIDLKFILKFKFYNKFKGDPYIISGPKIGFFGIGIMGSPIARNLIKAGYPLYNL